MKPATPLPWHVTESRVLSANLGAAAFPIGANVEYIVHAANNLPRVLEALRALVDDTDLGEVDLDPDDAAKLETARALLRELGEGK